MRSFFSTLGFRFPEGVRLVKKGAEYLLVCDHPIRFLQINRPLFELLQRLTAGESLCGLTAGLPPSGRKKTEGLILSLAAGGFLDLHSAGFTPDEKNYPFVSVIIPVKNRPEEIRDCLSSLAALDYPGEKLEIIVVDDGSTDNTGEVAAAFDVNLIRLPASRGPSACRNAGAGEAKGDILAFLDSDCRAGRGWLKELVPFFAFGEVGAVGGFVEGYFKTSHLDRYEEVFSSLNMGRRILLGRRSGSGFYVPTCNLLVREDVFNLAGGFTEGMHVGEDVDFCWRLRDLGYSLLYVPAGSVAHRHRNKLSQMLRRRFAYGTSEAALYLKHPEKKKQLSVPLFDGLSFLALSCAVLSGTPALLLLVPVFFAAGYTRKAVFLKNIQVVISRKSLFLSAVRSTFSFYYYAGFHLIRYYLVALIIPGFLQPPLGLLLLIMLALVSLVDYRIKKPLLPFPVFLFYYLLEHGFYQAGVFAGCLKHRYFRCYLPQLRVTR